jgi:hypothetical protein
MTEEIPLSRAGKWCHVHVIEKLGDFEQETAALIVKNSS